MTRKQRNRTNNLPRSLGVRNLVSVTREFAHWFLAQAQGWKDAPGLDYTGIAVPKVGEQLLILQYNKGKLFGAVAISVDQAGELSTQIGKAAAGLDFATIYGINTAGTEPSPTELVAVD